jgi:hypothetical protein
LRFGDQGEERGREGEKMRWPRCSAEIGLSWMVGKMRWNSVRTSIASDIQEKREKKKK